MDIENKYGTLEQQQYLIPILNDIDELCRKNGISYSLSHGSLLGAIRHKGFVPWDDDIDLVFDRANYEKLIALLEHDMPEDYCIVHDIWVKRIARKEDAEMGVGEFDGAIDLFVFDNTPDGALLRKLKHLTLKLLQGMIKKKVKYEGFSFGYKVMLFVTHIFGKLFTLRAKQRMYDKVAQWGNKKPTQNKRIYNCTFKHIGKIKYDYDVADNYTEVEFEGRNYMALAKWDHYLCAEYGDYMKLPPEEARRPKHKN